MRRIGVTSCVSGAGTRFFCANFACYLAAEGRKPAVIELGEGGLYDVLGMDKRFAGRTFCKQGGPPNLIAGVNWALRLPREIAEEKKKTDPAGASGDSGPDEIERFYGRLRVLDRTEGDVLLCNLNGLPEKERKLFLRELDASFVLADPSPARLFAGYERLKELREAEREEEKEAVLIVNKMNAGVRRRQLVSFLETARFFEVPLIPGEEICRAEYDCRVPYEQEAVSALLAPAFRKIWRSL